MRSSSFTPKAPRGLLLTGVAAVSLLVGIVMYALGALQPLQNAAIDESFTLAGTHAAAPGIVIVAVDDYTLQRIDSQLPVPRSYYARVLDILHAAHPELIGLDLQFIGVSAHVTRTARCSAPSRGTGPCSFRCRTPGQAFR